MEIRGGDRSVSVDAAEAERMMGNFCSDSKSVNNRTVVVLTDNCSFRFDVFDVEIHRFVFYQMLFLFTFILTAVKLTQSHDAGGGGGVLFR